MRLYLISGRQTGVPRPRTLIAVANSPQQAMNLAPPQFNIENVHSGQPVDTGNKTPRLLAWYDGQPSESSELSR